MHFWRVVSRCFLHSYNIQDCICIIYFVLKMIRWISAQIQNSMAGSKIMLNWFMSKRVATLPNYFDPLPLSQVIVWGEEDSTLKAPPSHVPVSRWCWSTCVFTDSTTETQIFYMFNIGVSVVLPPDDWWSSPHENTTVLFWLPGSAWDFLWCRWLVLNWQPLHLRVHTFTHSALGSRPLTELIYCLPPSVANTSWFSLNVESTCG